jgi:hypothetical protein
LIIAGDYRQQIPDVHPCRAGYGFAGRLLLSPLHSSRAFPILFESADSQIGGVLIQASCGGGGQRMP